MTPPEQRRVAIIIAAYNAEATIARAVRSALAEPETIQVCVVDDASADATANAARACDDGTGRLIVIRQPANAGPSAARNAALECVSAPWITILDADDFFLPGRLARLLAHANAADFIADELIRTPHPGNQAEAQASLNAAPNAAPAKTNFAAFVAANCGKAGHGRDLGFVKPLIHRVFLEKHGLRYQTGLRLGEDYELYARALALGARFLLVAPAGYVSIDRPGSISNAHSIADLRALRDCDDALAQIRPLASDEKSAVHAHRSSVDCRLQWRLLIEAVKQRDLAAAIKTFRSWPVAGFLAMRLAEQAWLRGPAKLWSPRPS